MIYRERNTKIEAHKWKKEFIIEIEEQDTIKEKAIVYALFDLIKALNSKEPKEETFDDLEKQLFEERKEE